MSLISYSADSCVRNAYYHNQCSKCVEVCPDNVFSIFQNRIKFDANFCTYCSACLGVCPTEAIKIDTFDPNRFSLEFKFLKENTLNCEEKTNCLSRFSTQHFSTMILESKENIKCDLSQCSDCRLGEVEQSIRFRISEVNKTLNNLEIKREIEILEVAQEKESGKRELFGKLFNKVSEKISIPEDEAKIIDKRLQKSQTDKKMYPVMQKIAIEALSEATDLSDEVSINSNSAFNSQNILNKCTNCKDCVQFCPTDALFASSNLLSIYIDAKKCIGCGICNDICKENAILNIENINLSNFVKPKELISFTMEVCQECKTPFIQRADEMICDRCENFVANFSSMLELARDI